MSSMSKGAIILGVVVILALAALFIIGVGKIGPDGGSVDVDMDKKTISWKSFERKEDLFAELNKLKNEKPEFLAVWLRTKGYLKTDDAVALRESGFFKTDDPQLISKFQEKLPALRISQNSDALFSDIRKSVDIAKNDLVIARLRTLSETGTSPFHFLGNAYQAASPRSGQYQPERGFAYVRQGSELERQLNGKIGRFYNANSNRSLELRVRSSAISPEVDIWFNRSQFCRLGLTQGIESIEVGPSAVSYGNYDPEIADRHFTTSPLSARECAAVEDETSLAP